MDLTLGLDRSRAADPAGYAIGGVPPRAAVRPATREEAIAAIVAAARDRLAIVPWGGGVGLAASAPPARYDVALDAGSLDRVVDYDPADLTITVECGITLEALREKLAVHGQQLPIEGALPSRATLGGALAANSAGPRRLRFGGPRDRILGARFVLGEGRMARTGGRVVKNVAGHAVHRLLCGSRGGLALMVEASLKLLPEPASRVALAWALDDAALADEARWRAIPRLEPAWMTVLGRAHHGLLPVPVPAGTRFVAVIGLEDDGPWVTRQEVLVRESLGPSVARVEGDAAVAIADRIADLEAPPAGGPGSPAGLAFVSAHRAPCALAAVLSDAAADSLVFHAPHGRLTVAVAAADARDLVARLAAAGFTLAETHGVEIVRDPTGRTAIVALRRRLRDALDPGAVFAYGERWVESAG